MASEVPGGATNATDTDSLLSFAIRHPVRYLWGLGADLWIALSTILLGVTAFIATLVSRSGRPIDVLAKLWSRCIVKVCGISLEVVGLDRLPAGQSFILICNHLSNFDIWCTLASMPVPVHFVAKKELVRVPVFGQCLAISDHILIDRQDPRTAIAKINKASANCPQGHGILFYAEGTRSTDGKIGPFKKGGVSLAILTGLPIIPLSVSGTRKFLPRRCMVIRPGGRVRLSLAERIDTAGIPYEARDELNDRVRQIIIDNYVEDLA